MHDVRDPDHPMNEDLAAARREVEGLRAALETRHTIGLAQGILMARHTLTVAQAFDYLRRRSQGDNVKLRTIAVDVVAEPTPRTGARSKATPSSRAGSRSPWAPDQVGQWARAVGGLARWVAIASSGPRRSISRNAAPITSTIRTCQPKVRGSSSGRKSGVRSTTCSVYSVRVIAPAPKTTAVVRGHR